MVMLPLPDRGMSGGRYHRFAPSPSSSSSSKQSPPPLLFLLCVVGAGEGAASVAAAGLVVATAPPWAHLLTSAFVETQGQVSGLALALLLFLLNVVVIVVVGETACRPQPSSRCL